MKDFFKKLLINLLVVFVTGALMFGLWIFVLGALAAQGQFKVPPKAVLVCNLDFALRDKPAHDDWRQDLSASVTGGSVADTISLREFLNAVDAASKDERITAIYLTGSLVEDGYSAGYGSLMDAREALKKFKAKGKKVVAWLENPTSKDYLLCSVADELLIHPHGAVSLQGMAVERMYLGAAAEKYGVEFHVFKAGRYKSAIETFIRTDMSAEDKEQTSVLLNDIWGDVLKSLAESRKKTPEQIRELVRTKALFLGDAAVKAGLADATAHFDEVKAKLEKLSARDAESKTFAQADFQRYALEEIPLKNLSAASKASKAPVALVYAEGEIVGGSGKPGQIGGDSLSRTIRRLREDDSVKVLVLRVNSPGGSAYASEQIGREVRLFRESGRPVVVSMGTYAASGGYWISADATTIFAEPTTITGSIGVFGLMPSMQRLANDHGVTFDGVKTDPLATLGRLSHAPSGEEMAVLQGVTDTFYQDFLKLVSKGRKKTVEQIDAIAQGRVWSGRSGLEVGLVDQLGGLEAALAEARKLASLPADAAIREKPARGLPDPMAMIVRGLSHGSDKDDGDDAAAPLLPATELALPAAARDLREALKILDHLNDPRQVYARLPLGWSLR